jgi:hypothetical protein
VSERRTCVSLLKEAVRRDNRRANFFRLWVPRNPKGAQAVAWLCRLP